MKCSSWLNILHHTRKCKIHSLALFSVSFVKKKLCTNKINDIYLKYHDYNSCVHMLPDILHSKHRSEGITIANFQVSLSDIPLFFLSFWSITEQFSAQTLMSTNIMLNVGLELSRWDGYSSPAAAIRPKGKEVKPPHCFWWTFSWRSSARQRHSGSVSWQSTVNPSNFS